MTEQPQRPLAKCGRVSLSDNVRIRVTEQNGYAEGVVHCGSIWACPVCAAKIRALRAEIYGASAARWLAAGNSLIMVTFTFPHDMGMRLAPMWDLAAKGVGRLMSSVAWRKIRASYDGGMWYRRVIECTCGEHGWHPHVHMLLYAEGELSEASPLVSALDRYFRPAWSKWVTDHGYRLPHGTHGVDVALCRSGKEAGEYLVKTQDGRGIGNELIRADLKIGRRKGLTPFEFLRKIAEAKTEPERRKWLALWWEWEQATRGRQAITQSNGLPAILGEDDLTDQELADAEANGDGVAELSGRAWTRVCDLGAEWVVFQAAARFGLPGVNALLDRFGIERAWTPPVLARAPDP